MLPAFSYTPRGITRLCLSLALTKRPQPPKGGLHPRKGKARVLANHVLTKMSCHLQKQRGSPFSKKREVAQCAPLEGVI